MALTTIPAHPDADSYISQTEAASYVTNHKTVTGAWGTATSDQKDAALRQATKIIDKFRFHRDKLFHTQRLKFPLLGSKQLSGSGGFTSTVITDTANLQKNPNYPDNWFKYGAVQNTTQTSDAYLELKEITASSFSNGTVTFNTFTNAVSASDQWLLISKIPDAIRWATVEIAMWVLDGNLKNSSSAGIKSESIGNYSVTYSDGASYDIIDLPEQARDYLRPYISILGNIL